VVRNTDAVQSIAVLALDDDGPGVGQAPDRALFGSAS
jgi:hypothetical protein